MLKRDYKLQTWFGKMLCCSSTTGENNCAEGSLTALFCCCLVRARKHVSFGAIIELGWLLTRKLTYLHRLWVKCVRQLSQKQMARQRITIDTTATKDGEICVCRSSRDDDETQVVTSFA